MSVEKLGICVFKNLYHYLYCASTYDCGCFLEGKLFMEGGP
jgi:hypothetical protein